MINSPRQAMDASPQQASGLDADATEDAPANAARANDAAIRAIIIQLERSSALPYRKQLVSRLDLLRTVFNDEGDGEIFSAESLRGALECLEGAQFLSYPSFTLTRSGASYVSWKRGGDHLFSAHFLNAQQVQFTIIQPNAHDRSHSDRFSGVTTPSSLLGLISHLGVSSWAAI